MCVCVCVCECLAIWFVCGEFYLQLDFMWCAICGFGLVLCRTNSVLLKCKIFRCYSSFMQNITYFDSLGIRNTSCLKVGAHANINNFGYKVMYVYTCMYQFYSTLVICAEVKGVREEVCQGSKVSLFASLETTLSHGEAIGDK